MNMCRQKELRGADRREMASTCYIAGPPPSLPHSCMTHMHVNLHAGVYLCGCLAVCPLPSVLSCASGGRQRDGCPLLSSPCLSSSHLQSCFLVTHANVSSPALLSSFFQFISPSLSLSLQFVLFVASLILSVSICALLILLISHRLSFSLHKSGADLPAQRRDSCPQHSLSLPFMPVLYLSPSEA